MKSLRCRLILPTLLMPIIGCAVIVVAQKSAGVVLAGTEKREITSKKIAQSYELLISLPDGYATSGKRYPVLYVLDGWHFPLMAFLQNNNQFSERMPPVIMVNISHGDLDWPHVRPLRAHDFTPTQISDEPGSGGAAAFLDFFEHELIPYVDDAYRTDKSDRTLLGHSYGGVFAIYALEQRPSLFQRIVAASPALAPFREALFSVEKLKNMKSPVRLDLSAGDQDDVTTETRDFYDVLNKIKPEKLEYRLTIYKGENHNSVRLSSFPSGLYWVYQSPATKLPSK
jgi:predicted alpha/beta superfamily hydrolase